MNSKRKGLMAITVAALVLGLTMSCHSLTKKSPAKRIAPAEKVRVVVLVYHSVIYYPPSQARIYTAISVYPSVFERQMRYLKDNGYHDISFQNLLDYWDGKTSLPEKPVIITFDDGWESQYKNAPPILKKFGYKATFFVYPNVIGRRYCMTWEQVRDLDRQGMTIGSHSKSHPDLPLIRTRAGLWREIATSKEILERHLGKEVRFFAYPFGEYDERIIRVTKEAGYLAARSVDRGFVHQPEEKFRLRGMIVFNGMSHFVRKLSE